MGEERRHSQRPLRVLLLRIEEWAGCLSAVPWRQREVKLIEKQAGMESAKVRRLGVRLKTKTAHQNREGEAPEYGFKRKKTRIWTKSHFAKTYIEPSDNVNEKAQ